MSQKSSPGVSPEEALDVVSDLVPTPVHGTLRKKSLNLGASSNHYPADSTSDYHSNDGGIESDDDDDDDFYHYPSHRSYDDDDDQDARMSPGGLTRASSTHFSMMEDKTMQELDAKYRMLSAHGSAVPHISSNASVKSSSSVDFEPYKGKVRRQSSFVKAELARPPPPPSVPDGASDLEAGFHSPVFDKGSRSSSFADDKNGARDPRMSLGGSLPTANPVLEQEAVADEPNANVTKNAIQGNFNFGLPSGKIIGFDSFENQQSQGTFVQEGEEEDPAIVNELGSMYSKVMLCLRKRKKFIGVSLQRESDNPKNESNWKIYPPPPPPSWKAKKPVTTTEAESLLQFSEESIGAGFKFEDCEFPPADESVVFKEDEFSVFQVYASQSDLEANKPLVSVPTLRDYYSDLDQIIAISSEGPAKSFAFRRLEYLEAKWNLYSLLNEYQETTESKRNPHRDFYNVRKVDTHVHHSAAMNQKHLLRFIKYKMKKSPDEKVIFRDGKVLTLSEVFQSLNLTAYDLSIDTLDMHAHKDTFHRFDKFNLKYNPIGESRLREIFLKTDNYIEGRYLAEITKEVMEDLEQSKYQMMEYRVSIYGRHESDWDKLAGWIVDNKLFSHNVRWLIQIPRLYDIYKSGGIVESFDEIVRNIFKPLFEVSKDPSSHPKLHIFLQRVIGFDSVDDESKPDRRFHRKFPVPKLWNNTQNPPYSYYLYYIYANLVSLNTLRKKQGFNTLVLRPHSGEAGDPEHLAAAYLVSHSISHGILLRKLPFIQYLYYLDQIGIAMSPLSNNALFLTYDKNPFHSYFKRGLNVSLSTDDPLQFAYTREPLIEEYSVAGQIYKLSNVDMCELARNSVLQSGFEGNIKKHWLGERYDIPGPDGNDLEKTNVPNVRLSFRYETLLHEYELMRHYCKSG